MAPARGFRFIGRRLARRRSPRSPRCCARAGSPAAPSAARFEEELAAFVGARHAVAVNSCTAALHLALEAAGVRRGDLVLVPTFTFAATAEVVRLPRRAAGARRLRAAHAQHRRALSRADRGRARGGHARCRAWPCARAGARRSCRSTTPDRWPTSTGSARSRARHGLRVIEDAAHALPAFARVRSPRAAPSVATRAGAVGTTAEHDLLLVLRQQDHHHRRGRDAGHRRRRSSPRAPADVACTACPRTPGAASPRTGSWDYEIVAAGFKYNLTDMAAALGRAQLKQASAFCARRAPRSPPAIASSSAISTSSSCPRSRPIAARPGTSTSRGCGSSGWRSIATRSSRS